MSYLMQFIKRILTCHGPPPTTSPSMVATYPEAISEMPSLTEEAGSNRSLNIETHLEPSLEMPSRTEEAGSNRSLNIGTHSVQLTRDAHYIPKENLPYIASKLRCSGQNQKGQRCSKIMKNSMSFYCIYHKTKSNGHLIINPDDPLDIAIKQVDKLKLGQGCRRGPFYIWNESDEVSFRYVQSGDLKVTHNELVKIYENQQKLIEDVGRIEQNGRGLRYGDWVGIKIPNNIVRIFYDPRPDTPKDHVEENKESLQTEPNKIDETEDTCRICLSNSITTALVPCGHLVLCYGCSQQISICPICRGRIDLRMKVYK